MIPMMLALAVSGVTSSAAADQMIEHRITPSAVDPRVKQFDDPSIAVIGKHVAPEAPLVIFMPGTSGKADYNRVILGVVAELGYRVISLEYNHSPPGTDFCPRDPDPECATAFREMRLTGKGISRWFNNPPAEAIEARLVAALKALDAAAPKEGWRQYLDGDQVVWNKIVVSGLSQGAGMAAFIAKRYTVRRVVLFSSPWDTTGRDQHPAPWLSRSSATPMSRWYAEYNKREKTAALIQAAYAALAIPPDHVRVFDLDLPPGANPNGTNPYHAATIHDTRYAPQWRAMYGKASDPAG